MNDKYKDYANKGIDYNLEACLDNNPQFFSIEDIEHVLAIFEGQNDEEDWHWIIELKDGLFVYLTGGCDFTGWGCRSSASSYPAKTPQIALELVLEHGSNWDDNLDSVYRQLKQQLETGKKEKTWHEQEDEK